MLPNCPEFHIIDMATLHLGATPFSIYLTSAPEQISYLFDNAENTVLVTESRFLPAIGARPLRGWRMWSSSIPSTATMRWARPG